MWLTLQEVKGQQIEHPLQYICLPLTPFISFLLLFLTHPRHKNQTYILSFKNNSNGKDYSNSCSICCFSFGSDGFLAYVSIMRPSFPTIIIRGTERMFISFTKPDLNPPLRFR